MKIEVGKRYIRRNGSVTPPLVWDKDTTTGWIVDESTNIAYEPWCPCGLGWKVFTFQDSDEDLMMEYKE